MQWFKYQLKFTSLNDFKTIIAKIFSFSSISEINFDQTIIDFSSQKYHWCFECDVQFSSTSQFLTHTQKNCFKSFTCKHCEKTFASNNKFYKHVRLHHIRKDYNKTLKQRFVEEKDNHINLSISRFISSTTFKSTSTILKFSLYSIIMMNASIVCFFTFSSTSSRSSIVSHKNLHTSSFYMTMMMMFEMFVEKTRRKNKNIMQKKSTFSCFFESRQTRIKSLCQQSFKNIIMFARKQFRKKWNIIHKRMRFSTSDQIQIINYFKFID